MTTIGEVRRCRIVAFPMRTHRCVHVHRRIPGVDSCAGRQRVLRMRVLLSTAGWEMKIRRSVPLFTHVVCAAQILPLRASSRCALHLGVFNMANALPQTAAPLVGAALLAINSPVNQNYDLLLYTAGVAGLIGAVVVLPIKKVR